MSADVRTDPSPKQLFGVGLDNKKGEFPRGTQNIPTNATTSVWFCDGPAVGLSESMSLTYEDCTFRTYLMFKPEGGIWVPLRLIQWEVHDEAYTDPTSPTGWKPITNHDGHSTGITGDESSIAFPHWTSLY